MPRACAYSSAAQHLDADARRHAPVEPAARQDHPLEGLALDVLHGQDEAAVLLAEVVEVDDVGVLELGQRLGLLEEAGLDVGVRRQLGRQDLERDLLVGHLVAALVDHAHAALPEHVDELVDPEDGLADERARRGVVELRAAHRARCAPWRRCLLRTCCSTRITA